MQEYDETDTIHPTILNRLLHKPKDGEKYIKEKEEER
jgi:hypothetical protein